MTNEIKNTLKEIGLTEGETQVYLALLELGLSSTGKIAKLSTISNSKVYEVLRRLINKGLAGYVIEKGTHYYSATPAQRLIDFLDEKQANIEKGKEKLKKLLPSFEAKRTTNPFPEAVVYRGKKGPLIALSEIRNEQMKEHESVGFGTNDDDYLTHFPLQLKEYIDKQNKNKLKIRMLFAEGFRSPNKKAKIRHLPEIFFSPVRTMVCNNTVAIVDFNKPMTSIIIKKHEIAEAYRAQFEALWSFAGQPAKIYNGREGALKALNEILEAHKQGYPSYGFGTEDYPQYFWKEVASYVKEAIKLKAKSKLILPEGYKTPNTFAEIRYIPKEYNIPVRVMIYKNKVALVDFNEPMTTIIIEKAEIANSFLNHFNILWKIAKP